MHIVSCLRDFFFNIIFIELFCFFYIFGLIYVCECLRFGSRRSLVPPQHTKHKILHSRSSTKIVCVCLSVCVCTQPNNKIYIFLRDALVTGLASTELIKFLGYMLKPPHHSLNSI